MKIVLNEIGYLNDFFSFKNAQFLKIFESYETPTFDSFSNVKSFHICESHIFFCRIVSEFIIFGLKH